MSEGRAADKRVVIRVGTWVQLREQPAIVRVVSDFELRSDGAVVVMESGHAVPADVFLRTYEVADHE